MKKFLFISAVVVFLILAAAAYFVLTTRGSAVITDAVITHFSGGDAEFGGFDGQLADRFWLRDVVIEHPAGLPADSVLKIQELRVEINSFGLKGIEAHLHNARLVLHPGEDPLVVSGSLKDGNLDLDIFSPRIVLSDILGAAAPQLKGKLRGVLSNADFFVKGPLSSFQVSGGVLLKEVQYDKFTLKDCPLTADLAVSGVFSGPRVKGAVTADAGAVSGERTAVVNIERGKLTFDGDPQKPSFDIKGNSRVENVKISIVLTGTREKPDLKLSSEPAMAQGRLLIMLATDRSWKGSEDIWDKKTLPADTVKDFIDYFVLSGAGSRLFREYGITEFSVQFEDGKKGVGVAKEISSGLEARYSVTQEQKDGQQPQTVQTVGGAAKLTDKVSIEAQKEIRPRNGETRLVDPSEPKENAEVILKYQTKF